MGHNALQAASNHDKDACSEILIEEVSTYIAALNTALRSGDESAAKIGTKRTSGAAMTLVTCKPEPKDDGLVDDSDKRESD